MPKSGMPATRFEKPGPVQLSAIPTLPHEGTDKDEVQSRTAELGKELDELEDLLYFAGTHSLLIVLQGMDTAGKDGTIRHLLKYSNAQSCRVASFKVPTPEEFAHDFLWRVHAQAPGRGSIAVFNRSHYEDVLIVRVHSLVPESVWRPRYERINEFERLLADANTIILKFFLHISHGEQEQRLLAREQDVTKSWKLSAGDWKERERWNDYQQAYEEAIGRCAQPHAPWLVVPADKKWYRDLLVTQAIVEALRPYQAAWMEKLEEVGKEAKAELAEYRAQVRT